MFALMALGVARPGEALAQATSERRVSRIGLLPDLLQAGGVLRGVLLEALREHGLVEARDYALVYSGADYGDPIEPAAERLVAAQPDVILVASSAHALAVSHLTSTIPIVTWTGADPVSIGLANSLAHPGRNVTGIAHYVGWEIWGKLLELLREARPALRRVGVAWGYVPPLFPAAMIESGLRELRKAAGILGLTVRVTEIASTERLPSALTEIDADQPEGLVVAAGPGYYSARATVLQFAVARRLPTIADFHWPMNDPLRPLLTYAPLATEQVRQSARFIARILRGANPGELPIELPDKLQLVVNLRMAKAIGLTISPTLLLRADRVIE